MLLDSSPSKMTSLFPRCKRWEGSWTCTSPQPLFLLTTGCGDVFTPGELSRVCRVPRHDPCSCHWRSTLQSVGVRSLPIPAKCLSVHSLMGWGALQLFLQKGLSTPYLLNSWLFLLVLALQFGQVQASWGNAFSPWEFCEWMVLGVDPAFSWVPKGCMSSGRINVFTRCGSVLIIVHHFSWPTLYAFNLWVQVTFYWWKVSLNYISKLLFFSSLFQFFCFQLQGYYACVLYLTYTLLTAPSSIFTSISLA